MRPVVSRVLLALLVVLAGCSAGNLPETSGPTVTPAAVPVSPPPGLSETGVVNASRLVAGHVALLTNTTATRSTNRTVGYPNGTLVVENRTTWAGEEGRLVVVRTRHPGGPGGYARWQNGSHVVGWVESADRRQYYTLEASSTPFAGVDPLGDHLSAALTTQRGASVTPVDCGDDRCLEVAFSLDERLVWGDGYPATGPVRYRLTVTTDGLVRHLVVTWAARSGDRTVTVIERTTFRNVGSTNATAPNWAVDRI
ncbi:hypothetical protein [Halomarina oriensis]|uniref:Lipoprotein n=1 Tax=Halomarina oriensis TaxID=671145 RepID=A0A6B0GNX5_9EURY|nr:hypothetical protein [Halomarina oriensis]MWG33298.1 hypothetical protein [Halomarina oriensis]